MKDGQFLNAEFNGELKPDPRIVSEEEFELHPGVIQEIRDIKKGLQSSEALDIDTGLIHLATVITEQPVLAQKALGIIPLDESKHDETNPEITEFRDMFEEFALPFIHQFASSAGTKMAEKTEKEFSMHDIRRMKARNEASSLLKQALIGIDFLKVEADSK